WTWAAHVDAQQRQPGRDRKADRLRLQNDTRPRRRRHAERTAKGRTERSTDSGDLVFRLERANAKALVLGKLLEDRRRRRDRIRAEEQRQVGQLRRREQPPRERRVAGDLAVGPRRQ